MVLDTTEKLGSTNMIFYARLSATEYENFQFDKTFIIRVSATVGEAI